MSDYIEGFSPNDHQVYETPNTKRLRIIFENVTATTNGKYEGYNFIEDADKQQISFNVRANEPDGSCWVSKGVVSTTSLDEATDALLTLRMLSYVKRMFE